VSVFAQRCRFAADAGTTGSDSGSPIAVMVVVGYSHLGIPEVLLEVALVA